MSEKTKFCSKCGAPLEENDLFCPVCGAKVEGQDDAGSRQKRSKVKTKPHSPPSGNEKSASAESEKNDKSSNTHMAPTAWSFRSIYSGFQWAIIWAVGWLPAPILLSRFYDIKRSLNPEFYAEYPRQWWSTLVGLTSTFTVGALIAGFIAGVLLYKTVNRKELPLGVAGILSLLGWALFWMVLLGSMMIDIENTHRSDGALFISMYILGPIYAALISWSLLHYFKRRYNASIPNKRHVVLGVYWAGSALLGLILMSVLGDLFTELFRGSIQ